MADGRHFKNGFYRYTSAGNHPNNLMKFGVPTQIFAQGREI